MERIIGKLSIIVIALMLCLALGTVGQAAVQDGVLVAHCFDDLVDDSGNGHDAVLGEQAYISGGLLYLDGDEDYADIGPTTFGAVNPLVDALSDFTIAVAYICTSTATGEGGSMLVSIGPAAAEESGDFSLATNNDGQYIDHWYSGTLASNQSGVGYADGTVHMAIVTYEAATDTYTFYHQTGSGGVSHGTGSLEWSAEWNEGLDYTPRLGAPRNATLRAWEGTGFLPDMDGQIDFFAIWNRILTPAEMEDVEDLCVPPHPCRPGNVSPPRNEEHVDYRNLTLDWSVEGGCNPSTTYDVYFGDSYPPSLQAPGLSNTYWDAPSPLSIDQTYYWQIIANVPGEGTVEGGEWDFKTGGKAWNESPSDGQNNVLISAQLSWDGDTFADSYDVYFGTDSSPDAGELVSPNQPGTTYDPPGNLDFETTYYWRIDEVIGGAPQTGDIWQFTTVSEAMDPCNLGFDEILFIRRPSFADDHFYTEFINYQPDVLRADNGIFRYNLKTHAVTKVISSADMPGSGAGVFYRFDLDWDASRIVFDYKDSITTGYRIWMCDIDGSNLTQITTTPPDEAGNITEYWMPGIGGDMDTFNFHYDDMHPCFTQEDTIIFTSTRCKYTTLCDEDGTLVTPVLYRINLNGSGLEKLTDSPVSEFGPSMMSDGRVVYTRWEYVDKDSLYPKAGFVMNPDGTHVNEIFGLDQRWPPSMMYFRQIPTNPNKFVFVGTPHYWQGDNLGPIMVVDRNKDVRVHEDVDSPVPAAAVTYVTPDVRIWREPGWDFWISSQWVRNGQTEEGIGGRLYTTPYPINENLFLVTCKYNESDPWYTRDAFDIYLIDTSGNHTQIVSQPGMSCWNPYPLKPRKKPMKINALKFPSFLLPNGDPNLGLALVSDVYKGMDGVARGDVKYLRINMVVSRPWSAHRINLWGFLSGEDGPHLSSTSWVAALWVRVQLGIVTVEDDGSAYFVVPADRNIFMQALDSEYREIQRERTYINFRPGEFRSCIGCHERSGEAPTAPFGSGETPMALQNDPCIPAPMPGEAAGTGYWAGWGVKVLHYPYDIQPILNSNCISCHSDSNPGGPEAGLDLSGDIVCDEGDEASCHYNVSFQSLMEGSYCGLLIFENNDYWQEAYDFTEYLPPYSLGSYTSTLADKLYNDPPHRARVTDQELRTIFRWVDTNYQFYGTYYGRHHGYWNTSEGGSPHTNFRPIPTFEEAISNEPPSWHN